MPQGLRGNVCKGQDWLLILKRDYVCKINLPVIYDKFDLLKLSMSFKLLIYMRNPCFEWINKGHASISKDISILSARGRRPSAFSTTHIPNPITAKIYFRLSMGNCHVVVMYLFAFNFTNFTLMFLSIICKMWRY